MSSHISSEKFSKNFQKKILMRFTRELIKHSIQGEVNELKNILEKDKEEKKEEIKEIKKEVKQILKENPLLKKTFKPLPTPRKIKQLKPKILTIPAQKLPPRFQYLKPTPEEIQIDLEKINPFLKDPTIRIIECNGPDEEIILQGTWGRKITQTTLTREEINQIIKKISQTAKIPLTEGIFRVAVGKLIFLAIISEIIGSKFIIKKINYSPNLYASRNQRKFNSRI